jgi:hypothetical protein
VTVPAVHVRTVLLVAAFATFVELR